MSLELNGSQFWVPGQQLVMLVIVDTRAEKNSYTNYYNPTTEEIIRACNETGIPHEPILNMIAEKRPDVHTLFVDVKKYLEACAEDRREAMAQPADG